ncbi:MAG: bacillithiol biosynthesis deacetylase BshB1 [Cytophagales bacterium]|nr:MAG: bacillithiol biosynthesis deacetylase BshB1 [Cytophagales bacterium]
MKLDILAIAAHPDDVELACSGTLMVQKALGNTCGILDLTKGEMGTRGTIEIRKIESENATQIIGIDVRENINLGDCKFENNLNNQVKIIEIIRKYQPEIVLINAPEDRHPDHGRASKLSSDACFYAGLKKIETFENKILQNPWRPKQVFHYVQDKMLTVDFVIDITPYFESKMKSIKAYSSQFFNPNSSEPSTYIADEKYFSYIEARATEFGHSIGVRYGEGFIKQKQIGIKNIFNIF